MMRVSKCALLLAAGLLVWGMPNMALAQEEAMEPAEGPPPVEMSLADAVKMSLENNLDIRLASKTPEIRQQDVIFRQAAFDPNLAFTAQYDDVSQPTQNRFFVTDYNLQTYTATFADRLRYGADYSATLNMQNYSSADPRATFPTTYTSSLRFVYNQSLLRYWGKGVNETQIVIARNNMAISESQFRQQMLNTLKATEDAYWELVFARRDLDVNRESLRLAEELLKLNRIKVQVGTLPPIEITQAEAEVANREQGVIVAENAVRDAEDNLRRVMNQPKEADSWSRPIAPTDSPDYVDHDTDVPEAMETAMSHRPDLEQARLDTMNNDAQLAYDRQQTKWDLNFRGTYTLAGQGAEGLDISDPNNPLKLDQTFDEAFTQMRDFDFPSWSAGLFLGIPIGNHAAESRYVSSRLNKEQSTIRYENAQLNAEVEIRAAARAIVTNKKRIGAAEKNVELQRKKVEAEQKKFENGMSTSFQVLTYQSDLTTALGQRNRALVDYRKSITALERAKGTLADYLQVTAQ